MKKTYLLSLFLLVIGLLTNNKNIKGEIVEAYNLRRGSFHIFLYGEIHNFNEHNASQNEYLEKILTQTQAPVIIEGPTRSELYKFNPFPDEFIETYAGRAGSPVCRLIKEHENYPNVICVENRTFNFAINVIIQMLALGEHYITNPNEKFWSGSAKVNIKKLKKNKKFIDLKKITYSFQDIFLRIKEILHDIETKLSNLKSSFIQCQQIPCIHFQDLLTLAKQFENMKATYEQTIDQWTELLIQNSSKITNLLTQPISKILFKKFRQYNKKPQRALKTLKLLRKIKGELSPKTRQLSNYEIIFEIYKQQHYENSKAIGVFTGINHTREIVKYFKSIGYKEKQKIKNNDSEPVPLHIFDWMLPPTTFKERFKSLTSFLTFL